VFLLLAAPLLPITFVLTNVGVPGPRLLASACKQNLKHIHLVLATFRQDAGVWPATLDETVKYSEARLVCPCSQSRNRDSGYRYRAPRDNETNEPLV